MKNAKCICVGKNGKTNSPQTNAINVAGVGLCNSSTVTANIFISRAQLQSPELLNPVATGDVLWG